MFDSSKLMNAVCGLSLLTVAGYAVAGEAGGQKVTAGEAEAAQVAGQLDTLLNRPVRELAKEGTRLASEILASLAYDRLIAECTAWEQLLEEARVGANEFADQTQQERAELKDKLQREMEDIAETYDEGPERDQQMVQVIQAYRPTLKLLKEQENAYRVQITQTDAQLLAVRHTRAMAERARRLKKQGLDLSDRTPLALPEPPTIRDVPAPEINPKESLTEALKSIEKL